MPQKDNTPLRQLFESFMKGHISRIPAERCPEDAFSDSQNIALNEHYVPTIALGQVKYNASTIGAYPTRGGIVYKTANGTKYYVVACAGFIWYSLAGSGTWAKYQVTLNNTAVDMTVAVDADYEFAQYNGKLYFVNGKYPIITNDHSSDHQYTANKLVKIVDTTVTNLTVSDIPQGLQYVVVDKERIYGANSIGQPSGIFWTNAYFDYSTNAETNWTPVSGLNYDYVGKDDGESITGLFPYQNSMFVFKSRNVYRYSTDGDITNWGSVRVDTVYGAPFNRTIKEMEGYLYWLSYDGVVRSDGTNCNVIDDNIREDILTLPQLSSKSRQTVIATTADFNAGTFSNKIIDTSANSMSQSTPISVNVNSLWGNIAGGAAQRPEAYRKIYVPYGLTTRNGNEIDLYCAPNIYPQKANYGVRTYTPLPSSFRMHVKVYAYTFGKDSTFSRVSICQLGTQNIELEDNYAYIEIKHGPTPQYRTVVRNYGLTPTVSAYTNTTGGYHDIEIENNSSRTNIYFDSVPKIGVFQDISKPYAYLDTWNNVGNNPVLYSFTDYYETTFGGSLTVVPTTIDNGFIPTSLGNISVSYTAPSGSSITASTRTSTDDITYSAWADIGTAGESGGAINSTVARYENIKIAFKATGTYPTVSSLYVGSSWLSAKIDLVSTPASWGTFDTVYTLNGQTITWWMRSATTSGGLDAASWVQQTPSYPITGVTLNQHVQVKIFINTTSATQLPIMESFRITWYTGANILKPCAYVWNKEYCLNVADIGQTVNNIVWRYSDLGYWLLRTNKYNNFYMIDEGFLLSGTSASDGYVRLNETGYSDDGVAIDAWFITKNVKQGSFTNIFRMYIATYKSDQTWTLSYSIDNGTTWVDMTIPASGSVVSIRKTLRGLVLARYIMLKARQTQIDANWLLEGIGVEYEPGTENRDD